MEHQNQRARRVRYPEENSFTRTLVKPGENPFRARSQARLVVFVARFARELGKRRIGMDCRCDRAETAAGLHRQHKLVQ